MSVTRYPDLAAFAGQHVAPNISVYGAGGVGKTALLCSAALPPLSHRVYLATSELRTLPEGVAPAIYAAGGIVVEISRVKDLEEVARELMGTKAYDSVVIDGWTVLNRETINSGLAVGAVPDMTAYRPAMTAMYQVTRLLRAAHIPIFSTMTEDWDLAEASTGPQYVGVNVPETARFYAPQLPAGVRKDWPAQYEALGRMSLEPPSGGAFDSTKFRWVQFAPRERRWIAKTLWEWHKPGLAIPHNECAALFLLFPWLQETGRLTPEQAEYVQKWTKKARRQE